MTSDIVTIPDIPETLREAAQLGKLVLFVGAGASKLAGCPDWDEFANGALRLFVDHGKFSHAQLDQIKHLRPRIKLSIALALQAESKIAGETSDTSLADKIVEIVRTVSSDSEHAGGRDNFHTFRKFAEILGLLPTTSITRKDLQNVRGWLNSKFDRDILQRRRETGDSRRHSRTLDI
jgi:hypothetical protein